MIILKVWHLWIACNRVCHLFTYQCEAYQGMLTVIGIWLTIQEDNEEIPLNTILILQMIEIMSWTGVSDSDMTGVGG